MKTSLSGFRRLTAAAMRFVGEARSVSLAAFGIGLVALSPTPSRASALYSAYYAFGDSLSDAGNDYRLSLGDLPRSPPYYKGHFSDGPTWADDVSEALGFGALVPSLKGGKDYAYGGATASRSIPGSHIAIPTIVEQVVGYAVKSKGKADPSALYSVWIGANDIIDALMGIDGKTLTLKQAEAGLAKSAAAEILALSGLVDLGARHILVGLVPDIGVTPLFNTTAPGLGRDLSIYYNSLLVTGANLAIPRGDLTYFNAFKLLDDATKDPAAYGLKNVTDACYTGGFTGGGTVCADPQDYLFWDHLHPTEVGHKFVADLALKALSEDSVSAVPLPASAPMFGIAFFALAVGGAVMKRRKALSA